jgi:hypothetical protein
MLPATDWRKVCVSIQISAKNKYSFQFNELLSAVVSKMFE